MSMDPRLEQIARRVNWYTEPRRLLSDPNWFLNHVMARGVFEDVLIVLEHFSRDDLKRAYLAAPPGLFTRRAWAYWGLMLLGVPDRPMPERFPGANRLDWRHAT